MERSRDSDSRSTLGKPSARGDAVGRSLGLEHAPALATRTLRKSQIGMSRLSIGEGQLGMTPTIPPEDTFVVALYLTGVPRHELWSQGRLFLSRAYAPNSIRIVNLVGEFSAKIEAPHETLVFYIPRIVLDEFTDEADGRRVSDLACPAGIVDPIVQHLGASLLPAFDHPDAVSHLYVDHVAQAICSHVATTYGGFEPYGPTPKGGLTARQAERAKTFMATHCDEDVSLAEVARECGLSRGYFTQAFKATTGQTPHQWRLRYRIDKAKTLLLETSTSLAEIAIACGFADQSHLTRVFSQHVGDSPASWRRRRRD